MKTKYISLITALTIALALPLFAQHSHGDTTKAGMTMHDMSSMMGKPTVDATVEGFHMQAWLLTQKHHKELMKGKMDQMMMHGEKKSGMGMMGQKDTSMGMGNDMIGMKHDGMMMDKALMDSMTAGTHFIMIDVTEAANGNELDSARATLLIVSPSEKNSSVNLRPTMKHLCSALTFKEKGDYQLTISLNANGVAATKQFHYAVK